jgi:hypothetical protein
MISKDEFLEGLNRVASMTNSVPPSSIGLWYIKFKHWEKSDWEAAIDTCSTELKFFPSVAQIYERRPKNHSTGMIEKANGWLLKSEPMNRRGSPELESEIDNLTDSELRHLFILNGAPEGVDFNIRMFRKNPNGDIYRGWIREAIKKARSRNEK